MPSVRKKRLARGLWWDEALSLVHGCSPVSEGCMHCWAAQASHMRASNPNPAVAARNAGLTEIGPDGPRFNDTIRVDREALGKPLRRRKPTVYAVWNDLFHPAVPFEFITQAFDVMCSWRWPTKAVEREGDETALENPGHTYLVLTKRPEQIPLWLSWVYKYWPSDSPLNVALEPKGILPLNIWLGMTAENQTAADARIPWLLEAPAAVHFVSGEPLLGPLDLEPYLPQPTGRFRTHKGKRQFQMCRGLDWVIVGGESGPGARPMHPDWARGVRDECVAAGVPFFFKQWGEWGLCDERDPAAGYVENDGALKVDDPRLSVVAMKRIGKKAAGRLLDGRIWRQFPTPSAAEETGR